MLLGLLGEADRANQNIRFAEAQYRQAQAIAGQAGPQRPAVRHREAGRGPDLRRGVQPPARHGHVTSSR